jgi:Carboxypeptidase regulatory-like domain/TonB dependent receptor
MSFQFLKYVTFLVVVVLLGVIRTQAQEFRGTLTGTVTDPQAAVVPSAKVELRNNATNAKTSVGTSDRGTYTAPDLDAGTYTVTVSANGFKTLVRNNITVRTGERRGLDFTLELGSASQQIVVSAEAPILITDTGSGGTVLNSDLVGSLPLLGSNVFSLINLTNGNSHVSAFPDHLSERPFDNGGMDGYSINGGPQGGNNNSFLMDGAPNNNNEGLGFVPPPDAVSEVNVMTNVYDAEYGKTGGGITSIALRSGTNAYHGVAYWNVRNNHLNANLYQNHGSSQVTQWSEPGFVVGGPVRIPHAYDGRDKTFFMVSYEHFFDTVPSSVSNAFPAPANLVGNFCGNPGVVIYDPIINPRTPFGGCPAGQTGSIIPANRIDPVMAKLLGFTPAPNVPGCSGGARIAGCNPNFQSNQGHGDHYHAIVVKIDHNLSSAEKFFASYEDGNRLEFIDNPGAPSAAAQGVFPITNTFRINHGATFNLTSTLSPTLISTFKVNWLRHNGLGIINQNGADPTSLGFSSSLNSLFGAHNFPGVAFNLNAGGSPFNNGNPLVGLPGYAMNSSVPYSGFSPGGGGFTSLSDTWTAQETVSKVVSVHSLKGGFLFTELLQNNKNFSAIPTLYFSDVFTRQNFLVPDNTGDAVADALLGYPTFSTYTQPFSASYADRYFALFFQDDWRVTKRLTLNLGLRWDAQSSPHERYNRAVVDFDPDAASIGALPNRVTGAVNGVGGTYLGGSVFATPDHRSPYHNAFNNWGPRFGLAYQITDKLVFRGGWGRFYDYVGAYEFPPSTGYSSTSNPLVTQDGYQTPLLCSAVPGCRVPSGNPLAGLSANGYGSLFASGLSPVLGSALGAQAGAGTVITFVDPNFKPGYVNQFNAGFDYQLPSQTVFHVEYNGSRSHNLIAGNATNVPQLTNAGASGKSINQLTASQFVNQGAALTSTSVPNPFAGLLPGTPLNGATVPASQLLLPFPQYQDVIETDIPVGQAWYNSLQARLEKRVTNGLTALVDYTWSKNMGATLWLNPSYDSLTNLVRAPTNIDQTHLLNIVMSYELPFFKATSNHFTKTVLGGWTISGTAQFQSGSLIAPFQTNTSDLGVPAGVFSTGLNPTKKNAAFSGQDSHGQWFNPCTLDPNDPSNPSGLLHCGNGTAKDAAWVIQPPFTLNKLNPFIDAMRFTRPPVASMSLFKAFAITENVKFSIRADAHNLTNTPWFGWGDNGASIDINPFDSSFGQVAPAQGNDPRTIQIAARLTF